MGKKRKSKQPLDPIIPEKLKRTKIINPEDIVPEPMPEEEEIDTEDISLSEDEQENENEEEQKDNYQAFLEKIQVKQNNQIINQETKKILKNLKKISINQTQELEKDLYESHFEFDHEKMLSEGIIKEKIIIKQRKKTGKEKLREKMMEIFDFKVKDKQNQDENKNQKKENQDSLNHIEIKDFELDDSQKIKCNNYQIDNYQQFILNKASEKYFGKEINGNNEQFLIEKLKKELPIFKQNQNFLDYGIYSILRNYADLTFIDPEEQNSQKFRKSYITHIINHIVKSNKSVLLDNTQDDKQNNKKTEKQQEKQENKQKQQENINLNEKQDGEQNVQQNKGFTRCKVLILTPFRGDANMIVKEIIQQYTQKEGLKQTSFKQRYEEYYDDPEKCMDDDFRLGIAMTKGKSIKLFSSFEHSDIIVCSPLSLRLKIGAIGDKDREFSFLSSIECLVLDRAQTLYMQNINHLEEIMEVLNKIPKHQKMNYSIEEIRPYFFENKAKFYRQNIVYTECNFPELNSIKNRYFQNYKGQLMNKPFYQPLFEETDLVYNLEFNKMEINDLQNEMEERFQYFKNRVWENWRNIDNTVIYCASYFEYLKLKDYFTKINASFQGVCEFTKKPRIQSRMAMWKKQEFRTILFNERAQYFDIWSLRHHRNVLFYSVPKNASIFKDIVQNVDKPSPKCKIQCIFTKYDAIHLEKIVGTNNAKEFLADYNKNTSFIL